MPKKIIKEEQKIGTITEEVINNESQGGNMDEVLLQKAKVIALKHGVAAAIELVDEVVALALQEAAAKSENKIDDAVVAVLIEPLKVAIKEQLNKLLV